VLQGSEDQVLRGEANLLRASRSGSVRHRLCSSPVQDGELLQASRDLLRRQDLVLLSSDELRWCCGSGCSRHSGSGREGSSPAAEGRSRSGSEALEGLVSLGFENAELSG
jgi:hypothetical protein